jgi:hypothetical protein
MIISQFGLETGTALMVFQPIFKYIDRHFNVISFDSIDVFLETQRLGFGTCLVPAAIT